jgi:transposase
MIIGIDVGKWRVDVAYCDESNAWTLNSYEQSESGYAALLSLVSDKATWFVMEATGSYFLHLANYLTAKGYRVAVLNPKVIHHYGKMRLSRGKTDKQDAQLIARYGMDYEKELTDWQLAAPVIVELQQLQSFLSLLKTQHTMTRNHREALSQHPNQQALLLAELDGALNEFKQRITRLENEIERLVLANWQNLYQRLLTIKGIGNHTATALLVITHGFTRFVEVKTFLSYCGLAPKPFESGTSVKARASISKMGSSRIRQLLYLCAWTAKRLNKPCETLYQRLKAKGKPEKVIKIAIAHKLLRQVFAIALSQQEFDASFP